MPRHIQAPLNENKCLPRNAGSQCSSLDNKQLLPFVREDTSGMGLLQGDSTLLCTKRTEHFFKGRNIRKDERYQYY